MCCIPRGAAMRCILYVSCVQFKMPIAGEYEYVLGSKKTDKTIVERFRSEPKFVVDVSAKSPLELIVTHSAVNLVKSMVEVSSCGYECAWEGACVLVWAEMDFCVYCISVCACVYENVCSVCMHVCRCVGCVGCVYIRACDRFISVLANCSVHIIIQYVNTGSREPLNLTSLGTVSCGYNIQLVVSVAFRPILRSKFRGET